MRATLWNEAVDRYEAQLHEGAVIILSAPGKALKMSNKKFTNLDSPYEVHVDQGADIQVCDAEEAAAANLSTLQVRMAPIPISKVAERPPNASVDVVGIVTACQPIQNITHKASGREVHKRSIFITDSSATSVEVALWGALADKITEDMASPAPVTGGVAPTVIALKGCRVSEWNTKSLSSGRQTALLVDPVRPEATALRDWWQARANSGEGGNFVCLSINERGGAAGGGPGALPALRLRMDELTLDGPQLSRKEAGDKGVYCSTVGFLASVTRSEGRSLWYPGCPKCSKKCPGDDSAGYKCEACGWEGDDPEFRYMLSCSAIDHSGRCWVSLFNDLGQKLMGMPASDLRQLQAVNEREFDAAFDQVAMTGPLTMRLRARRDEWNGDARLRLTLVDYGPTDFGAEAKRLVQDVSAVKEGGKGASPPEVTAEV